VVSLAESESGCRRAPGQGRRQNRAAFFFDTPRLASGVPGRANVVLHLATIPCWFESNLIVGIGAQGAASVRARSRIRAYPIHLGHVGM